MWKFPVAVILKKQNKHHLYVIISHWDDDFNFSDLALGIICILAYVKYPWTPPSATHDFSAWEHRAPSQSCNTLSQSYFMPTSCQVIILQQSTHFSCLGVGWGRRLVSSWFWLSKKNICYYLITTQECIIKEVKLTMHLLWKPVTSWILIDPWHLPREWFHDFT